MPLYEYYCADCRGKFEMLTTFEASEGDVVCTKCHGERVRKLFSVFASPRKGDSFDAAGDYGEGFDGGCSCGGACNCQD
ncbi:MAG: FmdB family zinc ribbon protein [Ktedonobacterales bacterium]